MHPIPNAGRSHSPPIERETILSSSEVGERAVVPQVPHDEHLIYRTGRTTTHPDLLGIRPNSPRLESAGTSPKNADGEVLRMLKALAETTLQEIRDDLRNAKSVETSKAKDVETIKKLVYHNYIYFPHPAEEAKLLAGHADPQRCKQTIQNLMKLDKDPEIHILSQRLSTDLEDISIRQAVKNANAGPDPGMAITRLLVDNFLILPNDWRTRAKTGVDGVESRLSICVQPEHADALANVLANLCKSESHAHSFAQSKFIGPRDHGIRNDTAIVYLSSSDPVKAAELGEVIHEELMRQLGGELQPSDVYLTPPPGSAHVRRGIGYSEKAINSLGSDSSGEDRAAAVLRAVLDCLTDNADLDEALARRLAERGYSPDNPAFALRPGEDGRLIDHRMLLLQSRDPESKTPGIVYPDTCLSSDQMETLVSAYVAQAGAYGDKGKSASGTETMSGEGTVQNVPTPTVDMMSKVIDTRLMWLEKERDALGAQMERIRHELTEIESALIEDDANEDQKLDEEAERLEKVLHQMSAEHAWKEALTGMLCQQRSNLNGLCQAVATQLNAARGDRKLDADTCATVLTASCITPGPALEEELHAALGRSQHH